MGVYFSGGLGQGASAGLLGYHRQNAQNEQDDLQNQGMRTQNSLLDRRLQDELVNRDAYEKQLSFYTPQSQMKIRQYVPLAPGWEDKWNSLAGHPELADLETVGEQEQALADRQLAQKEFLSTTPESQADAINNFGYDPYAPDAASKLTAIQRPVVTPGGTGTRSFTVGATGQELPQAQPGLYGGLNPFGGETPAYVPGMFGQGPQGTPGTDYAPAPEPMSIQTEQYQLPDSVKPGWVGSQEKPMTANQLAINERAKWDRSFKLGESLGAGRITSAYAEAALLSEDLPRAAFDMGAKGKADVAKTEQATATGKTQQDYTEKKTSLLDQQFELTKRKVDLDIKRIQNSANHNAAMESIAKDRISAYLKVSGDKLSGAGGTKPMTDSTYENVRKGIVNQRDNAQFYTELDTDQKKNDFRNLKRMEIAELDGRRWVPDAPALGAEIRKAKAAKLPASTVAAGVRNKLNEVGVPPDSVQLLTIQYMKQYYER